MVWNQELSISRLNHPQCWLITLLITSRWAVFIVYEGLMSWTHPEQSERVLLFQLFLYLVDGSLQTRDLHTQQGLVLVQSDQLPPLLGLQLHLQQLLLLVQELVQVAELGLNTLLQVSSVLLSRWKMISRQKMTDIATGSDRLLCISKNKIVAFAWPLR